MNIKNFALKLNSELKSSDQKIKYNNILNILATIEGYKNWNTYKAIEPKILFDKYDNSTAFSLKINMNIETFKQDFNDFIELEKNNIQNSKFHNEMKHSFLNFIDIIVSKMIFLSNNNYISIIIPTDYYYFIYLFNYFLNKNYRNYEIKNFNQFKVCDYDNKPNDCSILELYLKPTENQGFISPVPPSLKFKDKIYSDENGHLKNIRNLDKVLYQMKEINSKNFDVKKYIEIAEKIGKKCTLSSMNILNMIAKIYQFENWNDMNQNYLWNLDRFHEFKILRMFPKTLALLKLNNINEKNIRKEFEFLKRKNREFEKTKIHIKNKILKNEIENFVIKFEKENGLHDDIKANGNKYVLVEKYVPIICFINFCLKYKNKIEYCQINDGYETININCKNNVILAIDILYGVIKEQVHECHRDFCIDFTDDTINVIGQSIFVKNYLSHSINIGKDLMMLMKNIINEIHRNPDFIEDFIRNNVHEKQDKQYYKIILLKIKNHLGLDDDYEPSFFIEILNLDNLANYSLSH